LANELALVCEKLHINVYEAIDLANHHPRVNIHVPGPGVGGHCIPKDPWYIYQAAPDIAKLIYDARIINNNRPFQVINEVLKMVEGISEPVITIMGISYKANIDDARDTPSQYIIEALQKKKIDVRGYDPFVKHYMYQLYSLEDSIKGSDCIIFMVNHDEFQKLDIKWIAEKMRTKKIYFGTLNIKSNDWYNYGFEVKTFGLSD
jgi:UDP-N-acetyl-D-mannosaminuronic acid dehydrogenase